MAQFPSQPRSVRFGSFEVSFPSREVRKHGVRVRLPGQPFDILAILLERAGEVVTREELRQRLWPADTFVDFEHGMNSAVKRPRTALGDSADHPLYIETLARVGYRFIAPLEQTEGAPNQTRGQVGMRWKVIVPATVAVVTVAALVAGGYFYFRRTPKLSEADSIVLADFVNATGDPVFDGTLRQGLAVQLEQSPFLSIISDNRIQQTLRLMDKPPDTRVTPEIARDLCQRAGGKAYLSGSIANLSSQFVLGLDAVNCGTGDSLAEEQERATGKDQVLAALDKAAAKLRAKLGESLTTLQTFDTPIEQATTPSLEALQAYSLGRKIFSGKADSAAAVPLFQRAVRLDPNFAMSHALLGMSYFDLGETAVAAENFRKAYELRERVSEREEFYIESHYYNFVTGDLGKARQVYELWAQTYPRDPVAPGDLGVTDINLGQYDKALEEALRPSALTQLV